MRFSLKRALAATGYVALVAAAFAKPNDALTLLLWALTLSAFCYAVVAGVYGRPRERTMAAGFAVAMAVYIVCLWTVPYRMPWYWSFADRLQNKSSNPMDVFRYQTSFRTNARNMKSNDPNIRSYWTKAVADYQVAQRFQSVNSVAGLAAGLTGAGLGLLAFRRAHRIPSAGDNAGST